MSFCCLQQDAPNQRLPQPDFGAQSDGTRSRQFTGILSPGLDGLGDPQLRLCARASLGLHLTSEVLDNCGGSNCFTPKCELACSAGNICIDATSTSSLLLFTRSLPDSSTCDTISANLESWLCLQKNQEAHQVVLKAKSDRSNLLTVFPRGTTAMTLYC